MSSAPSVNSPARGALADARAARHATEQMAHAKDEILNIVSHDLRTPLSAIVLSAETVRRRSDDAAHSREEAVRIKRLAMAASGLVADIVDLVILDDRNECRTLSAHHVLKGYCWPSAAATDRWIRSPLCSGRCRGLPPVAPSPPSS